MNRNKIAKKSNIINKPILCILLFIVFLLSACERDTSNDPNYKYTQVDIMNVDNSLIGTFGNACSYNNIIYYLDENHVMALQDGTKTTLFDLPKDTTVLQMEATKDNLFYFIDKTDYSELNVYNLSIKENTVVCPCKDVVDAVLHDNDMFYMTSETIDAKYNDSIMYFDVTDETYTTQTLCEVSKAETETSIDFKGYNIYLFDNYGEFGFAIYNPLENWNHSAWKTPIVMQGKNRYMLKQATFYGPNSELNMEKNIDDFGDGGATSSNTCSLNKNKLYAVFEYGTGPFANRINVPVHNKTKDALICIDLPTQQVDIVYETKNTKEQIVGYSVSRNKIYLIREDGLYQVDFDGTNEKQLWSGYCTSMIFNDCGGHLIVYDASVTPEKVVYISE